MSKFDYMPKTIKQTPITPTIDLGTPLEQTILPAKITNILKEAKINTIGDLSKAEDALELIGIYRLGIKSISTIEKTLEHYGLRIYARPKPNKVAKARAKRYEPKVKFGGTFEDMIAISLTGAGAKKKETNDKK